MRKRPNDGPSGPARKRHCSDNSSTDAHTHPVPAFSLDTEAVPAFSLDTEAVPASNPDTETDGSSIHTLTNQQMAEIDQEYHANASRRRRSPEAKSGSSASRRSPEAKSGSSASRRSHEAFSETGIPDDGEQQSNTEERSESNTKEREPEENDTSFWSSLSQKHFEAKEPGSLGEAVSADFERLTRSDHAKNVEDRRRKDDEEIQTGYDKFIRGYMKFCCATHASPRKPLVSIVLKAITDSIEEEKKRGGRVAETKWVRILHRYGCCLVEVPAVSPSGTQNVVAEDYGCISCEKDCWMCPGIAIDYASEAQARDVDHLLFKKSSAARPSRRNKCESVPFEKFFNQCVSKMTSVEEKVPSTQACSKVGLPGSSARCIFNADFCCNLLLSESAGKTHGFYVCQSKGSS